MAEEEEDPLKMEVKEEYDSDTAEQAAPSNDEEEESYPESEVLLGPKGQRLYYDGAGYYYDQTTEDNTQRWLLCTHTNCGAKAHMDLYEGAPILLDRDQTHNHQPNQARRERIRFLHSVKTRHATEETPFSVIFQQELTKNPVGGSFFSFDKIEKHLQKKITQIDSSSEVKSKVVPSEEPSTSIQTRKTRSRSSPTKLQVASKRRKVDKSPLRMDPEPFSKKLQLLKTLQEIPAFKPGEDKSSWSEELQGVTQPSLTYKDNEGNNYKILSVVGNTRYLVCEVEGCGAVAKMGLGRGSHITLSGKAHSHHPKETSVTFVNAESSGTSVGDRAIRAVEEDAKEQINERAVENVIPEAQENNRIESPKIQVKPAGRLRRKQNTSLPVVSERGTTVIEDNTCSSLSERLEGPEFFHDFKGNYYATTEVVLGIRYLRCLAPTCMARASMKDGENGEITLLMNSPAHNHSPDLSVNFLDKIKEMNEKWLEVLPSERLPSLKVDYSCFHDGKGFYYYQTTQSDNIRYLTCSVPSCPARAHMCTKKDAPITLTPMRPPHNHEPDFTIRNTLLFLDAVKVRVKSGTTPESAIQQELTRNPGGACYVNLDVLKQCLTNMVVIRTFGHKAGITEDEVDFTCCIKESKESSSTNQPDQSIVFNHFGSCVPVLDVQPQLGSRVPVLDVQPQLESRVPVLDVQPQLGSCVPVLDVQPQLGSRLPVLGVQPTLFVVDKQSKPPRAICSKEMPKLNPKSAKVPALLSDEWLFHDCNGHYYSSKGVYEDRRYLRCVQPKCKVRAWMLLEPEAPINALTPHNHEPKPNQHLEDLWFLHRLKVKVLEDPLTPFTQLYNQVAEREPLRTTLISEAKALKMLQSLVFYQHKVNDFSKKTNTKSIFSAEKLPCMFGKGWQYHDKQGYYYDVEKLSAASKRNLSLRCIMKTCPSRAVIPRAGEGLITLRVQHNHEPGLMHQSICLFSHALKSRVRDEHIPISVIYEQEAKKFPQVAAVINENTVKAKLKKFRVSIRKQIDGVPSGFEEDNMEHEDIESQNEETKSVSLEGPYNNVYHNGRGYFFIETFSTNICRFLMCAESSCLAQAKMSLEDGAPITPLAGSSPHNHLPDTLKADYLVLLHTMRTRVLIDKHLSAGTILNEECKKAPLIAAQVPKKALTKILNNIRRTKNKKPDQIDETGNQIEEEELLVADAAAERLPSYQDQDWIYHDGRGYYFHSKQFDSIKRRHELECCEESCKAQAWLDDNLVAGVTRKQGSMLHNHPPNLNHRKLLTFLHRIFTRAHLEHCPVSSIFEKETKLDPEAAALIPQQNVEELLRNITVEKYFKDLDDLGCILEEDNQDEDFSREVALEPCEVVYAAKSTKPIYCSGEGYYYMENGVTADKKLLKCLTPLCKANAFILLSDSNSLLRTPVSSAVHNHNPDVSYRHKLLFIKNCVDSLLNGTEAVVVVYSKECGKDPIGAELVSDVAIKNYMYKLRKSEKSKINMESYCSEVFQIGLNEEDEVSKDAIFNLLEVGKNNKAEIPEVRQSADKTKENLVTVESSSMTDFFEVDNLKMKASSTNEAIGDDSMEVTFEENTAPSDQNMERGKRFNRSVESLSQPLTVADVQSECFWSQEDGGLIYHDGNGYVFKELGVQNNTRYLKCADCKIQAKMELMPEYSPILPLGISRPHDHLPDNERLESLGSVYKPTKDTPSKSVKKTRREAIVEDTPARTNTMPDAFEDSFLEETPTRRRPVKTKKYADYVTLEEENEFFNEEAASSDNDMDDPTFAPENEYVQEPEYEIGDELTDGQGYRYELVQNDSKRFLKCKNSKCKAKVTLTAKDKPLIKLFLMNPAHSHAPGSERVRKTSTSVIMDQADEEKLFNGTDEYLNESCDEDPQDSLKVNLFEQPFSYYDGVGYTYQINVITAKFRYLLCVMPKCKAQAYMDKESEHGPINMTSHCPAHSHEPSEQFKDVQVFLEKCSTRVLTEPDTSVEEICDQESALDPVSSRLLTRPHLLKKISCIRRSRHHKPNSLCGGEKSDLPNSELLPGLREEGSIYYDGRGYYFIFNAIRSGKKYLRCVDNECKVRGAMGLYDGAPISYSVGTFHNHQPDFVRRKFLLLLHRCRYRAANETTPIKQIYKEETEKDPECASLISSFRLKDRMHRARKRKLLSMKNEDPSELARAFRSANLLNDIPAYELVVEDPTNQDESELENTVISINTHMDETSINAPQIPICRRKKREKAPAVELEEEDLDSQTNSGEGMRSEILPGFREEGSVYYDGKGYYFIFNVQRGSKKYLRCFNHECKVRAATGLEEGSPIVHSSKRLHNHQPDFKRRDFLLLLGRCRTRAGNETTPVTEIYAQEMAKDPECASFMRKYDLLNRMHRARKKKLLAMINEEECELHRSFQSANTSNHVPANELVEDDMNCQDNSEVVPGDELVEEDLHYQDESELTYSFIPSNSPIDISAGELVEEDLNAQNDSELAVAFMPTNTTAEVSASELVEEDLTSQDEAESSVALIPENSTMEVPDTELVEEESNSQNQSEEEPEYIFKAAELIPGIRKNFYNYHDGEGYYYETSGKRDHIRYLHCINRTCKVRTSMEAYEGAPMRFAKNVIHNHQPDFKRRRYLLMINRCKSRAINETTPINDIYEEETKKDPECASLITSYNLKDRMHRARKVKHERRSELDSPTEEDHLEFSKAATSTLAPTKVPISELVEEDSEVEEVEMNETDYLNEPPLQATYCDDEGFSYEEVSVKSHVRYLKCIEPGCQTEATMSSEGESLVVVSMESPAHNHTAVTADDAAESMATGDDDSTASSSDENQLEQSTVEQTTESLSTSKRHYKERMKPDLTINPDNIIPTDVVLELDSSEEDSDQNEEETQCVLKPGEIIPGLRPDANNYHDGNGFYYELNRMTETIRYLKCLVKDCKARAYMERTKKNAPIVLTNFAKHNHGPDVRRKRLTIFLHRVTKRAAEESTPINVIYQQEVKRDPVAASLIKEENVKQRMIRFQKKHRQQQDSVCMESAKGTEVTTDGSNLFHFTLDGEESIEEDPSACISSTSVVNDEDEEGNQTTQVYQVNTSGNQTAKEVLLYEGFILSEVEVEMEAQQFSEG